MSYLTLLSGCSSYGFCHIWEVASKRILARFKLYAQSVDVSPDGRLLVAASFNGSVCIRKIRDGSWKFLWTGEGASWQTVDMLQRQSLMILCEYGMCAPVNWSESGMVNKNIYGLLHFRRMGHGWNEVLGCQFTPND
jgi:WD40 repeat protein